ncbi:MAG: hypothetical protein ACK5L5_08665 [Bacteroidales bacterium]
MQGRKQKIPPSNSSYPQNRSTACGSYEGVQTYIGYIEKRLLLKVNQEKTKIGYIRGLYRN